MLGRALTHGALRMSLYNPAKDALLRALPPSASSTPSVFLAVKIAAGASSGAFAALVSNPLELLKVRSQTQTSNASPLAVLRQLVVAEGVLALWSGVTASMQRSARLNVGQLACYDQIKHTLRETFQLDPNTKSAQIAASVVAGAVVCQRSSVWPCN